MNFFESFKKSLYTPTFWFFVLISLILIYFHTRGYVPYDDGWFLWAGSRFLQGDVPYKDLQYIYNPGSIYFNALSFILFGESILSSRILIFLNSIASVILLYLLGKKLKISDLFTALTIVFYVFWGPAHINFVWPVMICITTGLATCYLLLLGLDTKNQTHRNQLLFLAGILSAITFIFKQNFGLALGINCILALIVFHEYRNLKSLLIHSAGYASIILVQLAYFLFSGSLVIFFSEMYYFMFVKILQEHMLESLYPWQFSESPIYTYGKTIFYGMPLIFALMTLCVAIWKKSRIFLYITFCISFYLLSIRPTTDYIHLTPLISMMSITFILFYFLIQKVSLRGLTLIILLLLTLMGVYSAIFKTYYKWEVPLYTNNTLLTHPKAQIWTDKESSQTMREVVSYIEAKTTKGENIFIYGLSPMYYFLTERKNPTRYDYVHTGIQYEASVLDTIQILDKKNVRLILSDSPLVRDRSKIEDFILDNYQQTKNTGKYYFFMLKAS